MSSLLRNYRDQTRLLSITARQDATCGSFEVASLREAIEASCGRPSPQTVEPGDRVRIEGEITNTSDTELEVTYQWTINGELWGETTTNPHMAANHTVDVAVESTYERLVSDFGTGSGFSVGLEILDVSLVD